MHALILATEWRSSTRDDTVQIAHGVGLSQQVHPKHRAALPDQFRPRPVVADEVLGPAGEVGELRGGYVDPQPLVERGEQVAEMDRPGFRLLALVPARRGASPSCRPP